eukprot:1595503-Rhodomonas_salina.2
MEASSKSAAVATKKVQKRVSDNCFSGSETHFREARPPIHPVAMEVMRCAYATRICKRCYDASMRYTNPLPGRIGLPAQKQQRVFFPRAIPLAGEKTAVSLRAHYTMPGTEIAHVLPDST